MWGSMLKRRSLWILAVIWTLGTGAFMAVYQVTPLYFTKGLLLKHEGIRTPVFYLSGASGESFLDRNHGLPRRPIRSQKEHVSVVLFMTGIFTMLMGHANLTIVQTGLFLQGTAIMGFYATGLMTLSTYVQHRGEKHRRGYGEHGERRLRVGPHALPFRPGRRPHQLQIWHARLRRPRCAGERAGLCLEVPHPTRGASVKATAIGRPARSTFGRDKQREMLQ